MYHFTIQNYIKHLMAMQALLSKADAWAKDQGISEEKLLQARLAPDQFVFTKQIQSMSDSAKLSGAVLANIEVPSFPDTETTVEELHARITKTIDFLNTIKPESIDESTLASRVIPFKWLPGKGITADNHATVYSLPNFFFHYTTAYSILRNLGMPIGKADFMGGLPFVDVV
jgi:hypothetical protein